MPLLHSDFQKNGAKKGGEVFWREKEVWRIIGINMYGINKLA